MNTKEKVKEWDEILDSYENSIGFPKYNECLINEKELNEYFSMDRNVIEKLSPEDTAQISYRLSQFAFHIQRTLNREIARHNWAEETIKETIADELNSYKGYGYVEKYYQAIKHNEKAFRLNMIKKYATQRLDRLTYLSSSLKNLSDILINIQRAKGMVKNG